jgi:parvulin-like peptidyl-prolyl isomerase
MRKTVFLGCLIIFGGAEALTADSAVVARVGPYGITARDLLDSYEFGPAFIKRLRKPLRQHLEYMIYERLIATMAQQARYDTTSFVKERLQALEEDLTVEELYRQEILPRVRLSSEDIEMGIRKARIQTRFRWLYAESADEAQRLVAMLEGGASFDSLFARQKNAPSQTMESSLLRLEYDNPDFAREFIKLQSQQVSHPIAGPDGFYIVRIDELWQNPILTHSAEEQLRHQVVTFLTLAKAEGLAREYVRSKMIAANPVIKAEGFNIVRAYIAEKGLSKDRRVEWNIPATFMTEAGPRPISESPEFLGKTLVTFAGRHFTVREYVRWYDIRQLQLKTRSLEAFNSSLKQTIWKMVQDKLLSTEAYARGFHLRDTVRHETKKWEAKLLYLAGRAHLMRTIEIPEKQVRTRFEERRNRYRDASGKMMDYETVKREVWLELYAEEELKILYRTIQRLKNEIGCWVDEAAVERLHTELEPDASPIDVIFYKPGGTFPRRAFPTIDEQWIIFQ